MANSPDLQAIHDCLFELALVAGTMITAASQTSHTNVDTKKNSSDLVTETDKAVEDMIQGHLRERFPDYAFLGEETSLNGTLTTSPTFIVDPIDGTTNFVHGYPYVSVSLAFAFDRIPLVGIVYNPFTRQLYHAIKGQGSFLTAPQITGLPSLAAPLSTDSVGAGATATGSGTVQFTRTRLPLRQPSTSLQGLSKALVAVEWGNERSGNNWTVKKGTYAKLAGDEEGAEGGKIVHSLRSLGSAALNCCSVARGDLDAYWEGGCWAWDIAAGWVIVLEAGGRVVGANEGEWDPAVDGRSYLVVRGAEGGQEELVREFWGCVDGTLKY